MVTPGSPGKEFRMSGGLVVMTPIIQGTKTNVIRVERLDQIQAEAELLHIGGGMHTGILIRKAGCPEASLPAEPTDLQLEFTVFLVDAEAQSHQQEARQLRFWFNEGLAPEKKHYICQEFFKTLLGNFPKDYVGFIKRVLKLIQTGFAEVRKVELDLRIKEEAVQELPSTKDYNETGSEVECVTSGHVQEVLEHAYPNGLDAAAIATALRTTLEEVSAFLEELQAKSLVRLLESGEWLRVESTADAEAPLDRPLPRSATKSGNAETPTVAIITALFVEKLAVDAMIEDKQTYMRYKTDGESNVYTIGRIGRHRVVATKLSAVGHTRAAMIAAGSITTRLLGGFQGVEHVLVVGVGGGVPHYTDPQRHVRLGDVVVSAPPAPDAKYSYVYCDKIELSRATGEVQGYAVKTWNPKDELIADTLDAMIAEGDRESGGWRLEAASRAPAGSDYDFRRPPAATDQLTLPLGGGDVAQVAHPDEGRDWPRLHRGAVGAGRAVLASPSLRAEFAHRFSLRAYDGDFDAVVESVFGNRIDSWAMVRGIADYGDGMRSKEWQAYAALHAAATARDLVLRLPEPTL